MPRTIPTTTSRPAKSLLDRALSPFADVRAGEGADAVLMFLNIFLLLVCYSVIKTVREPLILLGGGAEVRSYAAAGQAVLLVGFVPAYSWLASRVDRVTLLVGVTALFVVCIELFAAAVAMAVPYIGIAFFIWVGIFNIALVAQFWSFANDVYTKDAGSRLFPIIVMGMTAGAPLGSLVAGRLFRAGIEPQVILQVSAVLLCASVALYLRIHGRLPRRPTEDARLASGGGFGLVLRSPYLRLVAALVVLLNVVNTTGEYLVARFLTSHVAGLALATPGFDQQAYIGAFSGDYQFWVNVTAFLLQAFVASRLVKHAGLAGVLLMLPLIALGGYALMAVGVGFSVVRWIKTAENATDYSVMNTARQLLWLPTTREEKYKAKQAIDTFFVRAGDVLSAGVVFMGSHVMHLSLQQFAVANTLLTLAWLGLVLRLLRPSGHASAGLALRPVAAGMTVLLVFALMAPAAAAQDSRHALLAAERADKATRLEAYEGDALERRLELVDRVISPDRPVYLVMGSALEGAGLALGPGYRTRIGDSGRFDARTTWSVRNYKSAEAALSLPAVASERVAVSVHGDWLDAPSVSFYGTGRATSRDDRVAFHYRAARFGVSGTIAATDEVTFGAELDAIRHEAIVSVPGASPSRLQPTFRRTAFSAAFDSRTAPDYSRSGGLYRIEWSDYHHTNGGSQGFRRVDAELQRFVPLARESWVLAFRALASTTDAKAGQDVPYFLLPELGGSRTLRGFPSFRFRDRNRLLLTGEYRWTAGPLVDMALFVDAGTVSARARDLSLGDLVVSHGIGVRLHTPSATITRIEVARSREGTSLILAFGPSF